jgi:integrase
MAVRKSKDPARKKKPWVLDYFDQHGKRHQQHFRTERAAKEEEVRIKGEVAKGIHTPDSGSATVMDAAELWLRKCEQDNYRPGSMHAYRSVVGVHIIPGLGSVKLAKLTKSMIEDYCNDLAERTTRKTAHRILIALKSILRVAQEKEFVAQNVAAQVKFRLERRRKKGIGEDVPSVADALSLIKEAGPYLYALLVTAIFTGLRVGELCGLQWDDIDFEDRMIKVRRTTDRRGGEFGPPKTAAGERVVPMSSIVVSTLREWRLQCPRQGMLTDFRTPEHKVREIIRLIEAHPEPRIAIHSKRLRPGISARSIAKRVGVHHTTVIQVRQAMPIAINSRLWLVFPSTLGTVRRSQCVLRALGDLQRKLGMVGADGKPKYTTHSLRHFFASFHLTNGTQIKELQTMIGHAHAAITWDTYGHLFRDTERLHLQMENVERAFLNGTALQQNRPNLQQASITILKQKAK